MKIFFGVLFLAAGQILGVNGWAVRFLSPPIDGEGPGIQHREGLVARHHHHQKDVKSGNTTESLDLSTVVGTAVLNFGNSTATVAGLDTLTINTNTISIPTGLVTDTVPATQSTDSLPRRTVTVTQTAIAFATTTATASQTNTSAVVALVTSATVFGGIPGQIAAASAPTAGEVITLAGGQGSFGGVVGAIVLDPSAATSTTTSDTDSTSSVATLSVETPVALGGNGEFGGVVGVTSGDADASITSTSDSAPTTTSYLMLSITPVPLRGVGAFGGVVGVQANSVNLISTASSVIGFGGITGVVAAPSDTPVAATVAGYKRNTFERAVNLDDGVPINEDDVSINLNLAATPTIAADATPGDATDATGTVVVINFTTTVDPVVTVLDTVAPTSASQTTDSVTTSIDSTVTVLTTAESTTSASPTEEVVTVTATITSTIDVPATAPTSLPSLTIGDLFPQCANFTGNVSALANLTIPDIVLPSNLTLLQVFNISGESIDCSILLQLLGVNETSTSLRKRAFFGARRTLHRFARGGR